MKRLFLISVLICAAMAGRCFDDCQAECKAQGMANQAVIWHVCKFKCDEKKTIASTPASISVAGRLGAESPYDQCMGECSAEKKSKGATDESVIEFACQSVCDHYKNSASLKPAITMDSARKAYYNFKTDSFSAPIARIIRKTQLLGKRKNIWIDRPSHKIRRLGKSFWKRIIPKIHLGKGFFKRIIPKKLLGKSKLPKVDLKVVNKILPLILKKGFFKRIIPKKILGKVNFRVIPKKLVNHELPKSVERPTILLASKMSDIINKAKDSIKKEASDKSSSTNRKIRKFMKAVYSAFEKYIDA